MAQKVSVLLLCDLHDDDTEATDTVTLGLDGSGYEIDLCEDHAAGLRESMAPYVGAARRSGKAPAKAGNGRARDKARTEGAPDPKEVRAWAVAQGMEVPARGRLPQDVIDKFLAA